MWTCPKCGREFRNAEQSHYCGKAPGTIGEYILSQPQEHREELERMRAILRAALPQAQERISWSMPTYWQGRNLIHFAGFKKHIGLYPGEEAVAYFAPELEKYAFQKGSIRIPYGQSYAEQSHYCGKVPGTIGEYILSQPQEHREELERMRAILRAALPQAQERISWSMPTYWQGRNLIHFAGFKKHIGLYPGEEAVAYFAPELEKYAFQKGSIRIPYGQIDAELITRVAHWCLEQAENARK